MNCNALFSFDTVQKLQNDPNINSNRYIGAMSRLEDRLSMVYIGKMTNFVWCAHGCGWGGQLINAEAPIFTCRHCRRRTCARHQVRWHDGMTCASYDSKLQTDREEQENQTWLRAHSKNCPKCNVPIEKNHGCNHMTCRHCKHEFCWVCLVDYTLIRENGSRSHATHCEHYE